MVLHRSSPECAKQEVGWDSTRIRVTLGDGSWTQQHVQALFSIYLEFSTMVDDCREQRVTGHGGPESLVGGSTHAPCRPASDRPARAWPGLVLASSRCVD